MKRFAALAGILVVLCLPGRPEAAAPSLAPPAATVHIAPHRALYDIHMVSKKSGSQVVNIDGKMYFEWRVGCDNWTTDHRFRIAYQYTDSEPMLVTSHFVTYEPFDGKSLSFNSQRSRNGEAFEELGGNATTGDDGGQAVYTVPPDLAVGLPAGTLFPMFHTVEMIRQAEAGRKFFNATVFDGSDDEGPVEINTVIGKRVRGGDAVAPGPHIDGTLLDVPAWKVRMAFFPTLKPAPDSEYEIDAILQANGIISDMSVDYRDFTITQKLAGLEALPAETCEKRVPGKKE
jgi:hypothetical protein